MRTGWKEHRFGLLNDMRSNKQAFPLMVEGYLALASPSKGADEEPGRHPRHSPSLPAWISSTRARRWSGSA